MADDPYSDPGIAAHAHMLQVYDNMAQVATNMFVRYPERFTHSDSGSVDPLFAKAGNALNKAAEAHKAGDRLTSASHLMTFKEHLKAAMIPVFAAHPHPPTGKLMSDKLDSLLTKGLTHYAENSLGQ
jgi:hypothetical protein